MKKLLNFMFYIVFLLAGFVSAAQAATTYAAANGFGADTKSSLPGEPVGVAHIEVSSGNIGQQSGFTPEYNGTALADPSGLSGYAYVYAYSGNTTVSGLQMVSRMSSDRDIIFEYSGIPGSEDVVHIFLDPILSASFSEFGPGPGSGRATGTVSVSGAVYNDNNLTSLAGTKSITQSRTYNSSDPDRDSELGTTLGIDFYVPRGETISVSAALEVRASGNTSSFHAPPGGMIADARNSLDFNPNSFFNILTPGITANSISLGLVNNQLPDYMTVPVPAALWLFGSGLLGLIGVASNRRTCTRVPTKRPSNRAPD